MTGRKILTAVSIIAISAAATMALAGDDQEGLIGGMIYDRAWTVSEFPLPWVFHDQGVINNQSVDPTNPNISNTDAQTEITQAFDVWSSVPGANLTIGFNGETTNGVSGCDRENIISWSDTAAFSSPTTTIARGISFQYTGADITVDDTNRDTVACAPLSDTAFPNGTLLRRNSIIDMDMVFNSTDFDFVTAANATSGVADIEAISVHEFGHMLALAHSSLAWTSNVHRATMFPSVSTASISSQDNVKTLELDDIIGISKSYSGTGFFPSGTAPFTSGSITGTLMQPDGTPAEGIRVWAYETSDTTHPIAEAFSVTGIDSDASLTPGSYILPGLPAGDYFVCIVPWLNNVATTGSDDPAGNLYNRTATNYNTTDFWTQCYQDDAYAPGLPNFTAGSIDTVNVSNGVGTPNIDFTTSRKSDIMLVMDRSGSMNFNSLDPSVTKLEALQNAADQFIDYLDLAGGHRLGLVQFEETNVPLTPVFDLQDLTDATDAQDAIDTMSAGGWTNIMGGVEEAVDQLTTIANPNPRQVIVLFTDGVHNRPLGSDLNDIRPDIIDNDIVLYSVGFGADLDDSILQPIADDSGGGHEAADTLSTTDLNKYFQNAAALAVDETLLIDPVFTVTPRRPARLSVNVARRDKTVTFALNWNTRDKKRIDPVLETPSGCKFKPDDEQIRRGENYQLIRLDYPVKCEDKVEHIGKWTLHANGDMKKGEQETLHLNAMGDSPRRLHVDHVKEKQSLLTARISGFSAPPRARISALATRLQTDGPDSTKEDERGSERQVSDDKPREIKKREPKKIRLRDNGRGGDVKAKDGVYSFPASELGSGVWSVRVMAEFYDEEKQKFRREALTTVRVGEK